MFSQMLLEALNKAPPRSLHDMRVFFDRSRARLEQSLDKGNVSGQARDDYLADFERAVTETQASFLNGALDQAFGENQAGSSPQSKDKALAKTVWAKQPLVWALIAFAFVAGLALGVVLGR